MLSTMKKKFYSSRDRFLEIAEKRTNSVLEKIRILGNCSNRQLYSYTSDEINKIFRSIDMEVDKAKARFDINNRKTKFKL